MITQSDTILLEPEEQIELLFKFQSFREASKIAKISTPEIIVQRSIRILFKNNDDIIK